MTTLFLFESLSAYAPETPTSPEPGSDDLRAAGVAMRDAIAADLACLPGIRVTMAVDQQEAGHAERLQAAGLISPAPCETPLEFVQRQSRLHDLCWVVAPETGGLLASLQECVGADRWIGCSGPAIRLAASKCATCAALARAGIVTPLAFTGRGHRPWIVKPDDGAGTQDTRRHDTRAAAEVDVISRQRAGRCAVAEPFVAGDALSISMVVGPDLARPVAFNRQRLHIDADGMLHDLGVEPAALSATDPRTRVLHALAIRVAAALPGLRGYVGIDLVWNEREGPVVIEVNPRVTCAYVGLSAVLQRNLAADILQAHLQPSARTATTNGRR